MLRMLFSLKMHFVGAGRGHHALAVGGNCAGCGCAGLRHAGRSGEAALKLIVAGLISQRRLSLKQRHP